MTTQTLAPKTAQWIFDATHSHVGFAVRHMFSTVKGTFHRVEVARLEFDEDRPELSSFEVKVDLASVSTNEAKRDEHLRNSDFFDVPNHPFMTFKSKQVKVTGRNKYDIVGDLTVRGVTREVTLEGEILGVGSDAWGGRRAGFAAKGTISRKQFGVNWNMAIEAGGFVVGDDVKIEIEAELVRSNS